MDLRKTKLYIVLFLSISIYAQKPYYPGNSWQEKEPIDFGIDNQKIDKAISFVISNENDVDINLENAIKKAFGDEPYFEIKGPTKHRGKPNRLIIKNGYIIGKWGEVNRVDMTFSVTKSYLSTVAGIAFQKELIDLEGKLKNYVWDGKFDSDHNQLITWHHLLNQSSQWKGTLFGTHDWADRPKRGLSIEALKTQNIPKPGNAYKYNDVRVNLLSYSLLNVFRKPLPEVLKTTVMDPIGASTTWRWYGYNESKVIIDGYQVQSVSGGGHFGGGIFINALDHARFGLLFLRGGVWEDKSIISPKWIDLMTKPSENNNSYGYMWWLNKGDRKWPDLSENIFYGAGFGGNYVVVVPDQQLVIVARWIDSSKLGEFIKKIIDAHG